MKTPSAALDFNARRCGRDENSDSRTSLEITSNGFDRLAPLYDLMECVLAGSLMRKVRTAFFDLWPDEGDVLLAGEGHGTFLARLRIAKPHLRITCLDSSASMISVAQRRLQRSGVSGENVTFVHADIRSWQPQPFDIISTQFLLDCFEGAELREVIAKLARSAKPDARWFLTDFQIPPKGFRRLRASLIVWLMYRFFRALNCLPAKRLESPLPILRETGFSETARKEWNLGLLYASWLKR